MDNNLNTPQDIKVADTVQSSPTVVNVSKSKKPLVLMLLLIILWIGSVAGVYFLTRSNKKSTNNSTDNKVNTSQTANQPVVETIKTTKFDYKKNGIPFTFNYPANWSITTNSAWLYEGSTLSDPFKYNITLLAQGTVLSETAFGGLLPIKGARIEITVSKKNQTVAEIVKNFSNVAGVLDAKKISINGLEAAQYYSLGESKVGMGVVTVFVQGDKQFKLLFSSDKAQLDSENSAQKLYDADKSSEHYKTYEALLNSLAF